jgi:hypothetical protein
MTGTFRGWGEGVVFMTAVKVTRKGSQSNPHLLLDLLAGLVDQGGAQQRCQGAARLT